MKLVKVPQQVHSIKECAGLLNVDLKYEVKECSGTVNYLGPKIPAEVWHQVLSFFKWTYDTTHSESQVRLYVNPNLQTWRAWAFPQKARTGMTTQEILPYDGPNNQKVAELPEHTAARWAAWGVEPSDDWILWGSVHHHCSSSAFQSGTDESNENGYGNNGRRAEGGLHITIGNLDKGHYDMHARFYVDATCMDPDMDLFWDIGDVKEITPKDVHNHIARWQMCIPSTAEFPQAWKDNLIEVKTEFHRETAGFFHGYGGYGSGYGGGVENWSPGCGSSYQSQGTFNGMPKLRRMERAADFTVRECGGLENIDAILEAFEVLDEEFVKTILINCRMFDVSPDEIRDEIEQSVLPNVLQKEAMEAAAEAEKGKERLLTEGNGAAPKEDDTYPYGNWDG